MEDFIDTEEIFRELKELDIALRRESSILSIDSASSQKKEWSDYWAW